MSRRRHPAPGGRLGAYLANWSPTGATLAAVFFALSLAPSLMPRAPEVQGALSGFSAIVGYWLGLFIAWLWRFLEIPQPTGGLRRAAAALCLAAAAAWLAYALWSAVEWQDGLRDFLGLEPVEASHTPVVLLVSLPLLLLLREAGRALGALVGLVAGRLDRILPRRLSLALSAALISVLLVNLGSGTLGAWTARALDAAFFAMDQLIEPDVPPPDHPQAAGGPGSLIDWEDLGRQGRRFVSLAPAPDEIAEIAGGGALRPIRIYVGLGAAETPDERAALALEELKRAGGFERSVLVVVTPTGTGWIDEAAVDSVEHLHRGDTAIVAMQYSYLTSYVSLFLEPSYSVVSARALFDAVYDHWRTLPPDARPKLYLHGLSLGSYGSEQSVGLYRLLRDPIHGAVWSGPTFDNPRWKSFTAERAPESPAWLPVFEDGSFVRFANQTADSGAGDVPWGPVRFVYVQYASDPVTFFSTDMFWREPPWLSGDRGPDVSPDLRWRPIITGLQVAFDMVGASSFGPGVGHLIAARDYVDAWVAVTEPPRWPRDALDRLKNRLGSPE
ncbi:MAG: alpha/beta-hydrolase family protein [Pseudomonadota bacterium]